MVLVSALAVDGRKLGEFYMPQFCLDHSAYNRFLSLECAILDDKLFRRNNLLEIRKFIAGIKPQSPYAVNGQGSNLTFGIAKFLAFTYVRSVHDYEC
jgi:hypothetical protein